MIRSAIDRNRAARRTESGFTLIELLIVIVILGILAAIVVFSVSGISDRGNLAACKADVAAVTTAEEAFFANPPAGQTAAYSTSLATAKTDLVPKYLHSFPVVVNGTGTSIGYTYAAATNSFAVTGTNGGQTC